MTDFSPREIVSELDRYIVGQKDAKRAVAIALRNRWRRLKLQGAMREEVVPYRLRQNRNCTPSGQIGRSAVFEDRGHQIH